MEKIISGQLQLVTSKVEEIFDFSEDVVEKIVQLSMHVYKTIKHGKLEDWKDDVDKFGSVIDSTNPVYETIKFDELDDLLPIVSVKNLAQIIIFRSEKTISLTMS